MDAITSGSPINDPSKQPRAMRTLLSQVAKRYVAGPEVADAQAVMQRYTAQELACTLGYWDKPAEAPQSVLQRLASARWGSAVQVLSSSDSASPGLELLLDHWRSHSTTSR